LRSIYTSGYQIAKAGVMLLDLQPQSVSQGELDLGEQAAVPDDRSQLMMTIDKLNQRYGKGIVHAAANDTQGERRVWTMRQLLKTPEYTTMWSDIPIARA
jgi:DNA polymerase V